MPTPKKPDAPAFDARTATREEVDAALKAIERDAHRARADATAKRTLDTLVARYAQPEGR